MTTEPNNVITQPSQQGQHRATAHHANEQPAAKLTHAELRQRVSQDSRTIISQLSKPKALRSLGLYAMVYGAIGLLITAGLYVNNPFFTGLVVVLIAARQHSLYILNHDGSHYSLFENKGLNKTFCTIFSNLVMFHHPEAWSFVQWRRVHMLHHKYLFTDLDPNYVGRRNKGDTKKAPSLAKLAWQVVSGGLLNIRDFVFSRQDHVDEKTHQITPGLHTHLLALFMSYRNDPEMENERWLKIVFFICAFAVIQYFAVWTEFLIYWILPMYTLYPMILHFHDLTEHRWQMNTEALHVNTRTRRDGWLVKLFLTALPRGYHSEHHIYPRVAVVNLAIVHQLLHKEQLLPAAGAGINALFKELAVTSRHQTTSTTTDL